MCREYQQRNIYSSVLVTSTTISYNSIALLNTTEYNIAPFDTVLTKQQRKAEQKHLGNHPFRLPHDSPRAA